MPLEKATVLLVVGVTDFPVLDFLLGVFFGDDEWLWAWWVGEEVGGAHGGGTVTGVRKKCGLIARVGSEADPYN